MGKYFAIVNKSTGEFDGTEGSGLYYVGSNQDIDKQTVNQNCILVELTVDEYDQMQRSGVDIERKGETLFVDKIDDLLPTDNILKNGCPNKININKAALKISQRRIETVNIYGVWYEGPEAVIQKRIEKTSANNTRQNGVKVKNI